MQMFGNRRKAAERRRASIFIPLMLILLFIVMVLSSCAKSKVPDTVTDTEAFSPLSDGQDSETAAIGDEQPSEQPSGEDVAEDYDRFAVHFIDVGQADATLIICDGEAMLIDGGWPEDSDLLFSYLKRYDIDRLKYIICTHPHLDHVGGLPGALSFATAGTAYSSVLSYDSDAFNSFLQKLAAQNCPLSVPAPHSVLSLGSATGEVIGPSTPSEGNNGSLVVRLNYGSTSFLFTGDAESEEELELVNSGIDLTSTLLKVSHHGSGTSTIPEFLDAVSPEYAVISCGAANDHGFPADQVLTRLKEKGIILYRTDMQGDIIVRSNGKELDITTERDPDADTYLTYFDLYGALPESTFPEEGTSEEAFPAEEDNSSQASSLPSYSYILNTNSRRFHYPDCEAVEKMSGHNRQEYFGTRDEVIEMGYEPCGICHP